MNSVAIQYVPVHKTGYGRMGLEITKAMNAMGIATPQVRDQTDTVPPVALFMHVPTMTRGWWKGQYSVLVTMFETTELSLEFQEVCPEFDMIVVPCDANVETFGKYNDNVVKIPLGVDPEVWHYTPRKRGRFTYLTVGAGHNRKNFEGIIKAFKLVRDRLEAGGFPKPQLIIKSVPELLLYEPLTEDPDVTILCEWLDGDDEVGLYEDAHCYVAATKGEGWGMCPHQAIAQGCPTILTDAAGHHEFSQWGIPLRWHYEEANYDTWAGDTQATGGTGKWWVPDQEDLVRKMLDVYWHYDECCSEFKLNAKRIAHLTWANTAAELVALLARHADLSQQIERGEWVTFERRLFPIRVIEPWHLTTGYDDYVMLPGQTYQETSGVRRMAMEQRVLHPDCLTDREMMLEKDGVAYRAKTLVCPTCKRPFPQIERSDS